MHARIAATRLRVVFALALAATVAACGGGAGEPEPVAGIEEEPVQPADPTGAGELKDYTPLVTIPAADIARALDATAPGGRGIVPAYGVATHRLEYLTTDGEGRLLRASGLVSVPLKAAGARSPVLSYQHATIYRDAQAPSNNAVASELAVVLASLGFIVVAPDYVGYGASLGTPHPYLLAEPSAAAVVDFLTAAETWRRRNGVADNGQLFMAGYSEGAYVTMAAHRALQSGGSPRLAQLRAAVTGAGPYDVQGTLDGLLRLVRDENRVLGALLDPGLLRYLGSSVRRELREELLERLLPDGTDVVFDTRFIDHFLADDTQAIAQLSDVHQWKPERPVLLFHGADDRTVPYASSSNTLQAMQARGAGDLVSLTDCPAVPSSHIGCVPDFIVFMLTRFAAQVQDL